MGRTRVKTFTSLVSLLIAFSSLAVLNAAPASAHGGWDQALSSNPDCTAANFRAERGGDIDVAVTMRQEFVPDVARLTGVDLCLDVSIRNLSVDVRVRQGSVASPGTVLTTGLGTARFTGVQFMHIDFTTTLTPTSGTKYLLEVPGDVRFSWRGTCATVAASCTSVDSDLYTPGVSNDTSVKDFAFRTYAGASSSFFTEETAFRSALPVATPDFTNFDAFTSGTTINDQIPGLLVSSDNTDQPAVFSTTGAVSAPNVLFGGFPNCRATGSCGTNTTDPQIIKVAFTNPTNAIGFFVSAFDPAASRYSIELATSDGLMTFSFADNDNNESTPAYFGIRTEARINDLRLISGFENNGGTGFEEFGLDNLTWTQLDAVKNLQLTVDEPSTRAGVSRIPFASVPADRIPAAFDAATQEAAPASRIPASRIPASRIPASRIDTQTSPASRIPASRIGLDAAHLGPVAMQQLDRVLISSLPTMPTFDLSEIVAASPVLGGLPFQTITLKQLLEDAQARAALVAKTYGDLRGFVTTVLRGIPALTFYLGDIPWANLPNGTGGTFSNCSALNALFDVTDACGQFGISPGTTTPLGAAVARAPASRIPASRIDALDIPNFASTALGSVGLRNFIFRLTPMANRRVSQATGGASSIVDCTRVDCTSATLVQAETAQAFLGTATLGDLGATLLADVTLQDLMIGIAGLDNVPWGSLDVSDAQTYAGNGAKLRYHANYDVDCSRVASMHVGLTLRGMVFDPGSATMQIDAGAQAPVADPSAPPPPEVFTGGDAFIGGDYTIAGPTDPTFQLDWNPGTSSALPNPCAGQSAGYHHVHLSYRTLPGSNLGAKTTDITVDADGSTATLTNAAPARIVEANEPNDDPATSPILQPRSILLGQVRDHLDTDYYRIPVAPRGSTVRMVLAPAPGKDYDFVVSIPAVQSPQSAPASRIPASRITVGHENSDTDNSDQQLPPETLEDTPASRIPASRISAHHDADDEVIEFVSQGETGYYTVAIAGYNGAHDDHPYRFWTTQSSTLPSPPCVAPTLPFQEAQGVAQDVGALPLTIPSTTETLFIVNRDMTSDLDGPTAASALFTKLAAVAARTEVKGAVLEVDGDPAVRSAVNAWLQAANFCSVDAANAVVRTTIDVINRFRTPSTKNIVIVGSDLHQPSWRHPDRVLAEADSASDLIFTTDGLTKNNAIFSATLQNYMLTDDAYGVVDQYVAGNRETPHAGLAVSRLVENADQISGQLQRYIDDDGFIDLAATASGPPRSLVTGYDFLVDGANLQKGSLGDLMGAANVDNLGLDLAPNNSWTRNEVINDWFGQSHKIVAPNAHFNHYLFEPKDAATDPFSLDDVVTTRDLMDASSNMIPGQLIFTVGCHAGRNVANYLIPLASYDEQAGDSASTIALKRQLRDWSETLAAQQSAVYIANRTYGYGDDLAPALSERLMAIFAELLKEGTPGAQIGNGTIGEKFAQAKDIYYRTKGTTYGDIDETVLLGANVFGMPTYRVKNGTFSSPVLEGALTTTNVSSNLDVASYSVSTAAPGVGVDYRPLTRIDAGGTSFWHQNGVTDAQEFRPLQPMVARSITVPNKFATGVLLKSLRTHDVLNIKPHEVFPVLDQASHTPDSPFLDAIWPAGGLTTTTSKLFGQLQQSLVLDLGYYIPNATLDGRGTERLIDEAQVEISYGDQNGPSPFITQVSALKNGDEKTFFVRASDGSGTPLQHVGVFYHTQGSGTWDFKTLTPVAGVPDEYSAGPFTIPGEIEIGAQVRSARSSKTAFSTRKGFLFNAVATTEDAAPSVTVDSPVEGQVTSVGQRVAALFSCSDDVGIVSCTSVDDAGWPVTNGALVDTSVQGEHFIDVTARDASGNTTTERRRYMVGNYSFFGFKSPVDNYPVVNTTKAGSTVPVKWQLKDGDGAYVRDLTAVENVVSTLISPCDSSRPSDAIEQTETLLAVPGLTYDLVGEQYVYKFATDKRWVGTCRRLTIYFKGTLVKFADFRFLK